jgi:hypothetical protein
MELRSVVLGRFGMRPSFGVLHADASGSTPLINLAHPRLLLVDQPRTWCS